MPSAPCSQPSPLTPLPFLLHPCTFLSTHPTPSPPPPAGYAVLVLIVLVNLLIAIVDETYGVVKESEADQILRNKVGWGVLMTNGIALGDETCT
jgi:hypothetical protein